MKKLECPEEAKYLVKDKKYCIYDCKADKDYKYLYNGNCIASCPEGTINDNYKCLEDPNKVYLETNILNIPDEENALKVVKTLAKSYVREFSYTQNHVSLYENENMGVILYENKSALKELSLEMPKVDFQNCLEKIKTAYNINGNLLTSVIEKKGTKNHQTSYMLFHPISGEPLEAESLCKNDTVEIIENLTSLLNTSSVNFKLQMSLTEQGINIFDLNDGFYKDICYDFDNPGKRDIALTDRVKGAYPDALLCEEGCRNTGINLGDMTASCDCTFNDITKNNIVKNNEILDSMVGEIFNVIDDSNILVVKCYKYIIKYFRRSYGGIITTIIIIINLILTVIFFLFGFRKLSKYILLLTKDYLKYLKIYFTKYELMPPKKKTNKEIKENKGKNLRAKGNNRSTITIEVKLEKIKDKVEIEEENHPNFVSEYNDTQDTLNNEAKKLRNFFKEYLEISPDDMEFDDAIKKDNRSFCKYFFDNIKEKQMIPNTFIASDPIKKRSIKIILFNINLLLYIVINGLFFSEVYISKLYNIKEKDEKFFSFLPRSIERLLYATIVSVIIGYLVDCFFIEEKKIIGIFKRERENRDMIKEKIIELIKEIKRRYISFIILIFILSLAFLYYLLCFNYVYPKSQMEWIKSSIAIIIIIQLLSILKIFAGTVFRYLSFCCQNEYAFKFSKIFN